MTKIKICGLTRLQDAEYVNEALPDYIGFVFAESRRKVTHEQAAQIRHLLDRRIQTVGVFVNTPLDQIAGLCRDSVIDVVQLHGDEDIAYMEALQDKITVPVIKAVRVQSAAQILDAQLLPCDYLLLDTWQKDVYGGSGKAFDWALIPQLEKPYFLAGGIGIENIREAMTCNPYCIDLSSGAETDGVKDRNKIIKLVKIARGDNE